MKRYVKRSPFRLLVTILLLITMISFVSTGVFAEDATSSLTGTKTVKSNNDGTYTVSLDITGMDQTLSSKTATDFIFCFDRSGSMANNDRLANLKKAMQSVTDTILSQNSSEESDLEKNRIAVVSFARDASTNITFSSNASSIKNVISRITAGGGTNYTAGLIEAASVKDSRKGNLAQKQCILVFLTDGVPTYAYTDASRTLRGDGQEGTSNVINCNGATKAFLTNEDFTCKTYSSGSSRYGSQPFYSDTTYSAQNWMGTNVGNGSNQFRSCYVVGYNMTVSKDNNNDCLEILAGSKSNILEANPDTIGDALNTIVESVLSLNNLTITDKVTKEFDIQDLENAENTTVTLIREDETKVTPLYYTLTTDTNDSQKVILSGLTTYDSELKQNVPVTMVSGDKLTLTFKIKPSEETLNSVFQNPSNNTFLTNVKGNDSAGSGKLGNDESGQTYYVFYEPGTATIPTTDITLKKIESGSPDTVLKGATFLIERQNGSGDSWTSREKVKTDDKGEIAFSRLPEGTYRITETEAPSGYIKPSNSITFNVSYDTAGNLQITNVVGAQLDGSTLTVSNEHEKIKLKITKIIDGSAANQADKFAFTVKDSLADGDGTTFDLTAGGSKVIEVNYKSEITITENDLQGYTASVVAITGSGEDQKKTTLDGTEGTTSGKQTYSVTIPSIKEDTQIVFTNTKSAPVVTGFITDTSGTSGIALVSITMISLGALLIYLKKRHF